MMNDWRDQPYTYENDNTFSVKLVAAAVVAVGFLGIGTFAYETGGSRPQNVQAVASSPFAPLAATNTSASTGPDSPPDLASPESPSTAAEPLKSAEADAPAVTAPASQVTEKPAQKTAADTPPVTAPAKPRTTEKLVKVSRAQRKTPATPVAEPVQFSAPAPEPQPAQAAPVEAAPAPAEPAVAAPAEAAPAVAEHADAPPQEAPMPAAADTPQAGAEAAPQ